MFNKRFSLALVMFLISPFCLAKAEKWYRVEVLIFETKDKQALAEEWPINPGMPSFTNAVSLGSDPAIEFGQLSDGHLALLDAKRKIQKNYHLVLHKAWRQTISDKEHAQKVHLIGGKNFGGEGANEVDGILRLSSGRFLHVDADLLFRKPMKVIMPPVSGEQAGTTISAKFAEVANRNVWQNEPDTKLQSFRMKESSRVKLEEIQYIDHPMYGMIIMVTSEKTDAKKSSPTSKTV